MRTLFGTQELSFFSRTEFRNSRVNNFQGIHSLQEYDQVIHLDIYPVNLLSLKAKQDFRDGLYFTHDLPVNVLVGWRRGEAYKELTNLQYVNLIQLIGGVNPVGRSYKPYNPNDALPITICHDNFSPCYRTPDASDCLGGLCRIVYNQECCALRLRLLNQIQ